MGDVQELTQINHLLTLIVWINVVQFAQILLQFAKN